MSFAAFSTPHGMWPLISLYVGFELRRWTLWEKRKGTIHRFPHCSGSLLLLCVPSDSSSLRGSLGGIVVVYTLTDLVSDSHPETCVGAQLIDNDFAHDDDHTPIYRYLPDAPGCIKVSSNHFAGMLVLWLYIPFVRTCTSRLARSDTCIL